MSKGFKRYALVWAVLVLLFHIVCFVTPNEMAGMTKIDSNFFTGIAFIDLAFVGQLVCAYLALKEEEKKKRFYNLPLITISYTGLIVMLAAGAAVMMIPDLPNWIGILVCCLVLGFTAVSVIKAAAAADLAERTEENVSAKTLFIKTLSADAEQLLSSVRAADIKEDAKRVYEAVRYSDPMSDDVLVGIESEITRKFAQFSDAAAENRVDAAKQAADDLIILIGNRNQKCRVFK